MERFAKIYAAKVVVDKEKMMKRLGCDLLLQREEEDLGKGDAAEGCDKLCHVPSVSPS